MTDKEIAETILQQLGGRRFLMMTGAKQLLAGERSLTMTLPLGSARKLKVTLAWDDTYTVSTYNRSGRELQNREQVYCDQLQDVFTELTGLYTHF